ncbi:MAG TPA: hypothetical protein VJ874_03650 [Candidatus Thermoplasmatota archaeon]|nr:hypothetical protein [Candidatus Thermoplasmatota archaeon]
MRVLVDVGHPAHVHLYARMLRLLEAEGHDYLVTARAKEVTVDLLKAKGLRHEVLQGKPRRGARVWGEWARRSGAVYRRARQYRPDILLGNLNPAIAHAGFLLRRPTINFLDHEPHIVRFPIGNWVTIPFTDTLVVPSAVRHDYGRKAIVVPSYKELAYLHPDHWSPDPGVQAWTRERTGGGRFALVRFVSWSAHHDVGKAGLSTEEKERLVHELARTMPTWISSEGPLPASLEPMRLPLPPESIHTVLHEAALFVGDSQTMATEAAVLGTPGVRSNQFVGPRDMGNFIELEERYGLLSNRRSFDDAMAEVRRLVADPTSKATARAARGRLLQDKIDLSAFLAWLVAGYPETARLARADPALATRRPPA